MPRPLYLYKTVTEQDSSQTYMKIASLCGDAIDLTEKAHLSLALSLKLLTNIDMPKNFESVHMVDLGVRIWNDLHVASLLISMGIYLQASMVLRDVIETMAVCEYLHTYPDQGDVWWKAETRREREAFSINTLKDKIKDGQEWKKVWDALSTQVHPNGKIVPLYAADKPKYGHNLFLGGFYYPTSVECYYKLQLSLCITFTQRLKQWYKDIFDTNPKLCEDIDTLENEYNKKCETLKIRTEEEDNAVVDKIVVTRLSREDVIEWFKTLDNPN